MYGKCSNLMVTPITSGITMFWGPTAAGRLLQVVFLLDEDDTVFIIHARPLTEKEKRRRRRRQRKSQS